MCMIGMSWSRDIYFCDTKSRLINEGKDIRTQERIYIYSRKWMHVFFSDSGRTIHSSSTENIFDMTLTSVGSHGHVRHEILATTMKY